MTQHTPGPWIPWDDGITVGIESEDGEPIAVLEIVDHGDMADEAQMEADHRLAAAAPDMLAALKDALMVLQSAAAADPSWTQAAMARDLTVRTIAKAEAEGRS